jgi:hypothetical protein
MRSLSLRKKDMGGRPFVRRCDPPNTQARAMEVRAPFATARLRLSSTQSGGETSMPVIVKYAVVTLVPLSFWDWGRRFRAASR